MTRREKLTFVVEQELSSVWLRDREEAYWFFSNAREAIAMLNSADSKSMDVLCSAISGYLRQRNDNSERTNKHIKLLSNESTSSTQTQHLAKPAELQTEKSKAETRSLQSEINQLKTEFTPAKTPIQSNQQIDPFYLAKCMIKATFDYLHEGKFGRDGEVRAYNILDQLRFISIKELQKPFVENPVVLLFKTLVSFSGSTDLRKMVLEYAEFPSDKGITPEIIKAENLLFTSRDYEKTKSAFDLPFSHMNLPDDKKLPEINWDQILSQLNQAIDAYERENVAGAKGQLRLLHAREAISKIVPPSNGRLTLNQGREVALLICAIVSKDCKYKSKHFAKKILEKTRLSEDDIWLLQLQWRISNYELNEKNKELISSDLSLEYMTIDNVKKAVTEYLNLRSESDADRNRAYNLQAALQSIDPANPNSKRDVVCLVRFAMMVGSDQLKQKICNAVQFTEAEIISIPEDHEEQFGDLKALGKKDAELVLDKSPRAGDQSRFFSYGDWVRRDEVTFELCESKINSAIDAYKKSKKPDQLGLARASNLLSEIEKLKSPVYLGRLRNEIIDRIFPDSNNEIEEYLLQSHINAEIKKQIITLICAVVLKSGSTDLKSEMLKAFDKSEIQFIYAQQELQFSHYAAWKVAKQLNQLTPTPDWKKFRDALLRAARFYRLFGESDMTGKIRAQQCISLLEKYDETKLDQHESQYHYVLLAHTMLQSNSTVLKENMTDLLSVECGVSVDDVTELKKQFGISSDAVSELNMQLLGSSKIENDFNQLKKKLDFAVACVLAVNKDQDSIHHAHRFRENINKIETELTKENQAIALLCLVESTLKDEHVSDILKNEILASLLMYSAELFFNKFSELKAKHSDDFKSAETSYVNLHVLTTVRDAEDSGAVEMSAPQTPPPATAASDSRSEAPDIALRVPVVIPAVQSISLEQVRIALSCYNPGIAQASGRQRKENILRLLDHKQHKLGDKKTLPLIICTIARHSTSTKLKRKLLLFLNMTKADVKTLQEKENIPDEVCQALEEKLINTRREAAVKLTVPDWRLFKDNFYVAVSKYSQETYRKRSLLDKLNAVDPTQESGQRQLALLACSVGLYLESAEMRKNVLEFIKSYFLDEPEFILKTFQIQFWIGKVECENVISQLNAPSVATSSVAMFGQNPVKNSLSTNQDWDRLKIALMNAAETAGSRSKEGSTQKTIASNFLRKLQDIQTPSEESSKKQLMLLVNTVLPIKDASVLVTQIYSETGVTKEDFVKVGAGLGIKKADLLNMQGELNKPISTLRFDP